MDSPGFSDERWALPGLRRQQQIPRVKRRHRCLSPSHESWFQITPYFKAVSMYSARESRSIFDTFLFLSTAFPCPFALSSRLWSPFLGTWTRTGNCSTSPGFVEVRHVGIQCSHAWAAVVCNSLPPVHTHKAFIQVTASWEFSNFQVLTSLLTRF